MKLSSNVVDDFNDKIHFPHKLLFTNTQVLRLPKAFANNSSDNIKSSKIQLHKIGQSGGFLGKILVPSLKTGLLLIGNELKPLAKSLLIPLSLTASASATNAAIHKKIFGSGVTALKISNKEMNEFMKIVNSLEESGLLIKRVSQTIKNEGKKIIEGFLGILLDTLGASLLNNLLAGKGTIRAVEGTARASKDF